MTMINRIRSRREATRRTRDIARALRSANSPAAHDEILAVAQRYYG